MGGLAEYLAGENDGPGGTSMPKGRAPKPRKPCAKCGAPKPSGRGHRYCATCERAPRRPPFVTTPCGACGSRENKQRGKQLCDECKALSQWRNSTRSKSRSVVLRQPCRRCGKRKSPGRGKQFCDACEIANRQANRCRNCKTEPVRAEGKRICVRCHEQSLQRVRELEAERSRRRTREGKRKVFDQTAYQRVRHDPAKWAHSLETQRLRRRLKAARDGRVLREYLPAAEAAFELPARPLALVFDALAAATDLATVCDLASVQERAVHRWRTGGVKTIDSIEADAILTALDLFWWEVWCEETVRRPLFVVHVYARQMKKTTNGAWRPRRIKTQRLPYGDQGPDVESLAEIAARMSGQAIAA